MDAILNNLALGFGTAITITNLSWCLLGVLLGTLVGVLPGLGPTAAISILLPLTYSINDVTTSLILIAGLYYGTQYGGSTTSILLNLPGEAASTVTTIDGYRMTQNGRGGAALAIAALASFFAGTVSTFIIVFLGQPLAELAFLFGPAENAALMMLGLLAAVSLNQGSFLKGVGMVLLGILVGLIGTDVASGKVRFDFGMPEFYDGISFAIVAMGIFGLGEIAYNLFHGEHAKVRVPSLRNLYPTKQELKGSVAPTIRGSLLGSVLGMLPGGGALISSFASYAVEKRIAKDPNRFGKGAVEGVAAPEAANNAGAQTSFIPMLSLGLPTNPVMALMIAVLIANGITPGPQVISANPSLFWGLIASMWIGNIFLVILNLPLVGIWVNILKISRKIMYPLVLTVCGAGAYYINHSWLDVALLLPFGALGYILRLLECDVAPMAMGFVVGSLFEEYLRRALTVSRGDWMVFVDRPLSLALLSLAVIFVAAGFMAKRGKNATYRMP